jgi:hypothetical protein
MKALLICLGAILPVFWHSAHAQQFNLYCLSGTSSTGAPSWAPASATTPCPVTGGGGGGGGAVTQSSQAGSATGNTWFMQGAGTAGTDVGGVLTIQGNASGTAVPISQSTASSLNATVAQGAQAGSSTGNTWFVQDSSVVSAITAAALTPPLAIKPASVTPAAGTAHAIVTGGTAVTMVTGPVNGCQIINPPTATDQAISTAENAYVNPVTTAATTGNNTTATLAIGQVWNCPGALLNGTNVSVNAATSAHAFTVITW